MVVRIDRHEICCNPEICVLATTGVFPVPITRNQEQPKGLSGSLTSLYNCCYNAQKQPLRLASRAAERARVVITLAHVLRGFQRGRSTGRVLGGNKQPFSRCRPSRVRIGAIQILEENMPVAVHLATN